MQKAEVGRDREEKRREEERRSKSQKKEDAGLRKGRKHYVFPIFWGSRGSKSRLADAAGAEPSGQMRDDTSLWREAHFEVKMLNIFHAWTTFGS